MAYLDPDEHAGTPAGVQKGFGQESGGPMRPFCLHEALPFTPFTTFVPILPNLPPPPLIGSSNPAPRISDVLDTGSFDALNRMASSGQFQQALGQVKRLRELSADTKFKFKTVPTTVDEGASQSSIAVGLSPLARLVLESRRALAQTEKKVPQKTALEVSSREGANQNGNPVTINPVSVSAVPVGKGSPRPNTAVNSKASAEDAALPCLLYASPKTQRVPEKKEDPGAAAKQHTAAVRTSSLCVSPQDSANPRVCQQPEVRTDLASSQSQELVKEVISAKKGITIELPRVKINKDEYAIVPLHSDEPPDLSNRKRKLENDDEDSIFGNRLNHQQRAHAASCELSRCLQTIIESENRARSSHHDNELLYWRPGAESLTLTPVAQQKLQSAVEKTIHTKSFRNVALDEVLHVMRLSDDPLTYAVNELDPKIDELWEDSSDVQQWVDQLHDFEAGMRAARTLATVMCGGREEKQVYSENLIDLSVSLLTKVVNGMLLPVTELRNSGSSCRVFKLLTPFKKRITSFIVECKRFMALMAELVAKIETSETTTNSLEFVALRLIFVEHAHAEKDTVVDSLKLSALRQVGMDTVSQIYLVRPLQRAGILDEILASLEKLPLTKQRARQFKLNDGTAIQPVSALLMRLVHATAVKHTHAGAELQIDNALGPPEDVDEEGYGARNESSRLDTASKGEIDSTVIVEDEHQAFSNPSVAVSALSRLAPPLYRKTRQGASYIMWYLLNRAMNTTKSGDAPYRSLLDMFVEDFALCLGNPDWPGAHALLYSLMHHTAKYAESENVSVAAKNLSLEMLGIVGAAIARLRNHVRQTISAMDALDPDALNICLCDLGSAALKHQAQADQVVRWSGPFRAAVEHLHSRTTEDHHLDGAISMLMADWGAKICQVYNNQVDRYDDTEKEEDLGRIAHRLRVMIQDRQWLSNEFSFPNVGDSQARLAYHVTVLVGQLCECYSWVVSILLGNMNVDQATVRSKSLKSVTQVLETDPSILEGNTTVFDRLVACCSDTSAQVRDSALGLLGKCLGIRPSLENGAVEIITGRFVDVGPGVRKRAMRLAKDVYLRNTSKEVRTRIAISVLHRLQDQEESIKDLARQMIEEMWFQPFYDAPETVESKAARTDLVILMVQTAKDPSIFLIFDKILRSLCASTSKSAALNMDVSRKLVGTMFEMVDNQVSEDPSTPNGRDVLLVLALFAKAEASLFSFEQIYLLKPYLASVASSEDVQTSRAVLVVYRRILPQLTLSHRQFLWDLRKDLLPSIPNAAPTVLDDLVGCVWILCRILEHYTNLVKMMISCANNVKKVHKRMKDPDAHSLAIFVRCCLIIGTLGKECDMEGRLELVQAELPHWQGSSVTKYMVEVCLPYAGESFPLRVRQHALKAIGMICQSNPRNFVLPDVYNAFQKAFAQDEGSLHIGILNSLKEFLLIEEKRSGAQAVAREAEGAKKEKRELTVMGGTSYDDVASATTQRFLNDITRISMSGWNERASLALEVLASISRQGLVHPKETSVTFMTLETSPYKQIFEVAYAQHRALHEKYETVVEREYTRAIQSAYAYQRDIVKDPRGATTTNSFTSKLHLLVEVLKISKSKNRQKFLDKLCSQVDFELPRVKAVEGVPDHVHYAQFVLENLAFLEYMTVGELYGVISALDKLFAATGDSLAQVMESEVFAIRMDAVEPAVGLAGDASAEDAQTVSAPTIEVETGRLRQLTAGAMVFIILNETRLFLRKQYGISPGRLQKLKGQAKDLSKPPAKVQVVTGDVYWENVTKTMGALETQESMRAACKTFVELMKYDSEFVSAQDEDELDDESPESPPADGDEVAEPGSGRGRKRKAAVSVPNGRKKRARSSSQPRKRGRPKKNPDAGPSRDDGDEGWC